MKLQTIIELKQSYISVIIVIQITESLGSKKLRMKQKKKFQKHPLLQMTIQINKTGGCFGIVILTFVAVSFFDAVVPQ